ncbi:anti-sigma factor domain-containing protein [Nitratireductor kimnyeongensis]|uniref:Anti-sigma factor domain-containing protein n=1 Tax=Nitratireductor kimnyeongensis TaxID=430679 RepID=A0ABW0T5T5_9HYPH|nr:anti-sigma factor [Nitratireductor kimnyeongensis]QZZ34662.1 anti-sigma factor [Nitratireductor kimnyeongensis]
MTVADENGPDGRDDDLVAAEYVLGVLAAHERATTARRIETEGEFARLVEAWEAQLAPMADAYESAEPPANAKSLIDARLFGARTAAERPGLWSSLAFWRGAAMAALVALVAYVALTYTNLPFGNQPLQEQRFVASLAHDDTDVRYLAVYDGTKRDVALSHVSGARPDGRDFELWAIEGDNPPVSLGVIPVGSSVHVALSEALGAAIEAGAVFAITTEPLGGSPDGTPTGPVVALGDLRDI